MSSTYTLEPVTKGKVILHTTLGDFEIELWAKEAPKAVRNFVQLCLEGFYSGCTFHRVVKDFCLQTGDPKGDGGESIYGGPFADEFNQRLRFTRRGLVAMANTGPHSNLSQFFITLNKTEELTGKNTIFGKVVGDTIFNVLKVNDMEVENEQLVTPQRILSAEVLANPFDDIIPRVREAPKPLVRAAPVARPVAKNLSLLSFGDDADEPEQEAPPIKKGKSAYHFMADEKVQMELKAQEKEREEMRARAAAAEAAAQAAAAAAAAKQAVAGKKITAVTASDFDESMRERLRERKRTLESTDAPNEEEEQLRREIMEMKKKREEDEEEDDDKPKSFVQAQRAKYLAKKKQHGSYAEKQKAISARVEAFRNALKEKGSMRRPPPPPPPAAAAAEPEVVETAATATSTTTEGADDWKSHELRFEEPEWKKTTVDAVLKAQANADDQYEVYDPLSGKAPSLGISKHKQVLLGQKKGMEKW